MQTMEYGATRDTPAIPGNATKHHAVQACMLTCTYAQCFTVLMSVQSGERTSGSLTGYGSLDMVELGLARHGTEDTARPRGAWRMRRAQRAQLQQLQQLRRLHVIRVKSGVCHSACVCTGRGCTRDGLRITNVQRTLRQRCGAASEPSAWNSPAAPAATSEPGAPIIVTSFLSKALCSRCYGMENSLPHSTRSQESPFMAVPGAFAPIDLTFFTRGA